MMVAPAFFRNKPISWLVRKNLQISRWLYERYFDDFQRSFFSFQPEGPPRGRVLISHGIWGFLLPPGAPQPTHHTLFGEVRATVDLFLEQGYAVDLIAHRCLKLRKKRRYDIFFGAWDNMEAIAAQLNPDCIRIVRLDITHWAFNNHASLGRSLEVQGTRGITPRQIYFPPSRALECADYAVMFGNDFVHSTYAFAGKPIFAIPHPAISTFPRPEDKDYEKTRNRFLWLGSRGLAHKGLGLVLEAFARMPELHLTVCGPLADEPAFVAAYRRELYETPNIHAHGWIDVTGPEFAALTRQTLAMVYPSCAEAEAGAVINCLQAGLIPVVSRETGLDTDSVFGITLRDNSVETIVEAVRGLAARPTLELEAMAQRTWEHARATYTRDNFKRVLGGIIERIAAEHPNLSAEGFIRYTPAAVCAAEMPAPARP